MQCQKCGRETAFNESECEQCRVQAQSHELWLRVCISAIQDLVARNNKLPHLNNDIIPWVFENLQRSFGIVVEPRYLSQEEQFNRPVALEPENQDIEGRAQANEGSSQTEGKASQEESQDKSSKKTGDTQESQPNESQTEGQSQSQEIISSQPSQNASQDIIASRDSQTTTASQQEKSSKNNSQGSSSSSSSDSAVQAIGYLPQEAVKQNVRVTLHSRPDIFVSPEPEVWGFAPGFQPSSITNSSPTTPEKKSKKKKKKSSTSGTTRTPEKKFWCHQCKLAHEWVIICTKSSCGKKYCPKCIARHYNQKVEDLDQNNWLCYCCKDLCTCALCRRRRARATNTKFEPLKGKRKKLDGIPPKKRRKTADGDSDSDEKGHHTPYNDNPYAYTHQLVNSSYYSQERPSEELNYPRGPTWIHLSDISDKSSTPNIPYQAPTINYPTPTLPGFVPPPHSNTVKAEHNTPTPNLAHVPHPYPGEYSHLIHPMPSGTLPTPLHSMPNIHNSHNTQMAIHPLPNNLPTPLINHTPIPSSNPAPISVQEKQN